VKQVLQMRHPELAVRMDSVERTEIEAAAGAYYLAHIVASSDHAHWVGAYRGHLHDFEWLANLQFIRPRRSCPFTFPRCDDAWRLS